MNCPHGTLPATGARASRPRSDKSRTLDCRSGDLMELFVVLTVIVALGALVYCYRGRGL